MRNQPASRFVLGLATALAGATTAMGCTGGDAGGGAAVVESVPPEAMDPPWLERRHQFQSRSLSRFQVFHDFAFSDEIEESGIRFRHKIVPDAGKYYKAVHYDHGNGVAVADVDGDGLYDIYFVSQVGGNQLWKNLGGGRFENITDRSGVAMLEPVNISASFADIDNDGDADLYVTTVRNGNRLFENDGTGRFTDISERSGVDHRGHSSAATFFDYDRDGLLDLFLANVGVYTHDTLSTVTPEYASTPGGESYRYYEGVNQGFHGHLKAEFTERSILFRNLGGNRFADVSDDVGLRVTGWNGDATPIDGNDDGWPDLYVLDMQGLDQYFENVGGKRFVRKDQEVFPRTPWGSMGVKVFDYDNDGRMDIYLTDMHSDMSGPVPPDGVAEGQLIEKLKSRMQWEQDYLRDGGAGIYGNAFFRNEGGGRFVEISDEIGVETYWPWGLSVGDLNSDGYEDIFIASGMGFPFRYGVNTLLLNNNGKGFLDSEFILGVEPRRNRQTATPWLSLDCAGQDREFGPCEGRTGRFDAWGARSSRSSVIFDLDEDGDLDIVTNEFNAEPMVLVSDLTEKRAVRFLKVKLTGRQSNRSGLGAIVRVRAGTRTYAKVHDGKSGHLSQSLLPLYFGLGDAETVDQIEVVWPSGRTQVVAGPIEINTTIEVTEQ